MHVTSGRYDFFWASVCLLWAPDNLLFKEELRGAVVVSEYHLKRMDGVCHLHRLAP